MTDDEKIHRDTIEDILDDIWYVIQDDGWTQEQIAELNIWQSKKAIEINQLIQKGIAQARKETAEKIFESLDHINVATVDKLPGLFIYDAIKQQFCGGDK